MKGLERLESSRSHIEWSAETAALLGKVPDDQLARRAGVCRATVAAERRRRRIEPAFPHRPPVEWTEAMTALLGTDTDRAVAEELAVHPDSVRYRRMVLGIPAFRCELGRRRRRRVWSRPIVGLLGRVSDGEVARRLGVSRSAVARRRVLLGIPPWRERAARVEWTEDKVALLGGRPDRDVAAQLGVSRSTVMRKRLALGIAPFERRKRAVARSAAVPALLRLPNSEAMRRGGIGEGALRRLRREYGIPAPRPQSWRWAPEVIARLGQEPDTQIAEDLGVASQTVWAKRRRLGIAACRQRRRLYRLRGNEGKRELEARLAKVSDRKVAEEVGSSRSTVRRERLRVGLGSWQRRWSEEELRTLGDRL